MRMYRLFFYIIVINVCFPAFIIDARAAEPKPATVAISHEFGEAIVKIETPLGSGSGFVVHERGFILTCAHVIKDPGKKEAENSIVVTTVNIQQQKQNPLQARVISIDEFLDLALIKIPGTNLPTVKVGDSNTSGIVGLRISLIGYPLGGAGSITDGIISAVDEERGWWRTNAAMYKGNSGGPVFDLNTREVLAVARGGWGKDYQGVNFVIPINYANNMLRIAGISTDRKILEALKKSIDNVRFDALTGRASLEKVTDEQSKIMKAMQIQIDDLMNHEIKPGKSDIQKLKADTIKEAEFKRILLKHVQRSVDTGTFRLEQVQILVDPRTESPIELLRTETR